jgi:hypothetical protein
MAARIALPLSYALGAIRTSIIMVIAAIYLVVVSGLCTVLVRGFNFHLTSHFLTCAETHTTNTQGYLICIYSTPVQVITVCSRSVVDSR